jgi:hypothetical protein
MGLQQIANQYDTKANHLAIRHEGKLNKVVGHTWKDGKRVPMTLADVIQNYRTSADRVRALILPEDEVQAETHWQLENERVALAATPKFSGKDKVANPKELIEKANKE